MSGGPVACSHCGERIVQRLGDRRWVHFHGGQERCYAATTAAPAYRPSWRVPGVKVPVSGSTPAEPLPTAWCTCDWQREGDGHREDCPTVAHFGSSAASPEGAPDAG